METGHREVIHVRKPCLKLLALINASHELLNPGQDCRTCLPASRVIYAGADLITNTKGVCLSRPPSVQVTGKANEQKLKL